MLRFFQDSSHLCTHRGKWKKRQNNRHPISEEREGLSHPSQPFSRLPLREEKKKKGEKKGAGEMRSFEGKDSPGQKSRK